MQPVYKEVTVDTVEVIRGAGIKQLKAAFNTISKVTRNITISQYYHKLFNFGHNRVYRKGGKHRKGQYIPKTLKGRFSQVQISRAIREIENVVPPTGWTQHDLLIHLKSR